MHTLAAWMILDKTETALQWSVLCHVNTIRDEVGGTS